MVFKKSISITGKIKDLAVINGKFCDVETGDIIDLANILEDKYGTGVAFELSTKRSENDELGGEDSE